MTTLVLTELVTGGALCASLGYVTRGFVERHLEARRERAVVALGGELPAYERRAREMEDQADEAEIGGFTLIASDKRQEAAAIRRVTRRTLRKRRRWLP